MSRAPDYPNTMFNALNRFISRLDGDGSAQKETPGSYGFQVLRNTNPDLAIEPWYDFVVGINGRMIVRHFSVSLVAPHLLHSLSEHSSRSV